MNIIIDVLMMSTTFNDILILTIWGVEYRSIINGINNSDAVNLLGNADLAEEGRVLKELWKFYYHIKNWQRNYKFWEYRN